MRSCLLALLILAPAAHADEPQPLPKNLIVADLGLHVLGLGFQRSFTPQLALQLAFDLYVPWTQNQNLGGLAGNDSLGDTTGLVARLRAFVYPDAHAPTGFWLSPFVQAGLGLETRDGQKQQGLVWAAGASAGWAWLLKNRIHLALGLGVQYHAAKFPRGPGFGRFYPTIDIVLGYAF